MGRMGVLWDRETAVMGRCLNRGLRVLSEPQITQIFADGL